MRPEDHYVNDRIRDPFVHCPECDADLVYVPARRVRAVALLSESTEVSLHMTDMLVCGRCHWCRPVTVDDVSALGGSDARPDR